MQSSSVDWPLGTGFLILLEMYEEFPENHCQSIINTWGSACEKQCVGRDRDLGSTEILAKDAQGNVETH